MMVIMLTMIVTVVVAELILLRPQRCRVRMPLARFEHRLAGLQDFLHEGLTSARE